jgi:hypothetical protein
MSGEVLDLERRVTDADFREAFFEVLFKVFGGPHGNDVSIGKYAELDNSKVAILKYKSVPVGSLLIAYDAKHGAPVTWWARVPQFLLPNVKIKGGIEPEDYFLFHFKFTAKEGRIDDYDIAFPGRDYMPAAT